MRIRLMKYRCSACGGITVIGQREGDPASSRPYQCKCAAIETFTLISDEVVEADESSYMAQAIKEWGAGVEDG